MSRQTFLTSLTLGILTAALLLAAPSSAQAQGGNNRIRLTATMFSGAMKGVAKYDNINNNARRKFQFELEKGPAGSVVAVFAGTTLLGTTTVNGLGTAKIDLDSKLGHNVPVMTTETLIRVKLNGVQVMAARLR